MLRQVCNVCRRVWYCEGNDICKEAKFINCSCPQCCGSTLKNITRNCKEIEVKPEWRIA